MKSCSDCLPALPLPFRTTGLGSEEGSPFRKRRNKLVCSTPCLEALKVTPPIHAKNQSVLKNSFTFSCSQFSYSNCLRELECSVLGTF